jgi:hypothetical protein
LGVSFCKCFLQIRTIYKENDEKFRFEGVSICTEFDGLSRKAARQNYSEKALDEFFLGNLFSAPKIVYYLKELSGPELTIQGAELDGFAYVVGSKALSSGEVCYGARDF